MKINITYLSALDNISVSNLPIPLSYSCSEISNISGADIIYIGENNGK
tara:strand:+ start:163 stop:306 length:144 start_codon:yes stop_codon:yes gene_type:complete